MKPLQHNSKILNAFALKLLEQEYRAAWAARDLDRCVEVLGKVIAINPRSANALLLLGRIHGVRYEYDKAIEWFDKAVEVSPQKQHGQVLLEAGNHSRDFLDRTIAETFYSEAVEAAGSAETKLALADHLMRIRKRDQARLLVDEVLKAAPANPKASLLHGLLNDASDERDTAQLERLLKSAPDEVRVKAGYQLARLKDRLGDYEGAMLALASAKSVLMKARNPAVEHRKKIRPRIRDLAMGFTPTTHDRWGALGVGEAPQRLSLLGGHPRSGTTLLEQVLDSHPDIVSAEETENFSIFAFSPLTRKFPQTAPLLDVMNDVSAADLALARDQYFTAMDNCLDDPVGARLLVDKNPSLTPLAPAFYRIFPETRFVTMIRDPRDVILSCYMQPFFPIEAISGNFLTLEDTVAEVSEFMTIWSDIAPIIGDNALEVRYEKMVDDLEGTSREVLQFLGEEWNPEVMNYDRHAREKIVRSPTADAVTEKVHSRATNRWKNYAKFLEPLEEQWAPIVERLGY